LQRGTTRISRFYLDRIDLRDPAHPELLPELSIPGSLVSYDPTSETALSASYEFERGSSPAGSCIDDLELVDSRFDAGTCFGIRHGWHIVRIGNASVEILDSAPIDGVYRVETVIATGTRSYWMLAAGNEQAFKTLIVDTSGGELTVAEVADAGSYYGFAASASRLAFADDFFDPSITALDTTGTPQSVLLREPIRWDTLRHLSMTDNWVVAAFGELGARSYFLGEH
jgi:hypothetical protein